MIRRLLAEGLGSMILAAAVIGSGIMAQRLAGGNEAVALLANTAATVAALSVLIAVLGPVSGAHFNPVVSVMRYHYRELSAAEATAYVAVQIAGCCCGALLANAMFELPILQTSQHVRTGVAQWLAEIVATAGLIVVIVATRSVDAAAWRVAAWIGAAYWFTASTSFANPAITLGRTLSDTFAGIRPLDAPGFIVAQLVGGALGVLFSRFLGLRNSKQTARREAARAPR